MCGPAGSGKSVVARALEAEGMVRLSFDQQAWDRGHRRMPLPDAVHRDLEEHLRGRLVELVSSGRDVVLDFSFWSRRMREEWRGVLRPLGVTPETVYLATDRTTALARVQDRANRHGDDLQLEPGLAARYVDQFEPPTEAEGPLRILSSAPQSPVGAPLSVPLCPRHGSPVPGSYSLDILR